MSIGLYRVFRSLKSKPKKNTEFFAGCFGVEDWCMITHIFPQCLHPGESFSLFNFFFEVHCHERALYFPSTFYFAKDRLL